MSWATSPGTASPKQVKAIERMATKLGVLDTLLEELQARGCHSLKDLPMLEASRFIKELSKTLDALREEEKPAPARTFASFLGNPRLQDRALDGHFLRPGASLADAEEALYYAYGRE